ncbi:VOC family protein [Spirillospora sp. CA-255316]
MDNVLINVDDLEAAIAFFAELGMEVDGKALVEGDWAGRVIGLEGVRADIVMMRTPDGHGRVELSKFHTPSAISSEPRNAPSNTLGMRRIMFTVDDLDEVIARLRTHGAELSARWRNTRTATGSASSAAPKGSSSDCPSSSADGPLAAPRSPGRRAGSRRSRSVHGVRLSAGFRSRQGGIRPAGRTASRTCSGQDAFRPQKILSLAPFQFSTTCRPLLISRRSRSSDR